MSEQKVALLGRPLTFGDDEQIKEVRRLEREQERKENACKECSGHGHKTTECQECDGTGEIEEDCSECKGTGENKKLKKAS